VIWLDDQFGFYPDDAFLKPMNASVSPKKANECISSIQSA
jgi:hypothetical protein